MLSIRLIVNLLIISEEGRKRAVGARCELRTHLDGRSRRAMRRALYFVPIVTGLKGQLAGVMHMSFEVLADLRTAIVPDAEDKNIETA